MTTIKFSDKEIKQAKAGIGIYSKSRIAQVTLRTEVLKLIEKAFREFCKSHKMWTQNLEDKTWDGFKKVMSKYL